MPEYDYDAVIVGGGPAGSTAGAYLARAGMRTLIVEKERFPRFHIGESVMPVANAILRETGVWDKVERAGFVPKYGAEFHVANRSVRPKHVEFSRGLIPGLDYTFQVERAPFDEILLDHAAELGATVRQETRVTGVRPIARDGYEVTLQPAAGGAAENVRCAYLVDASGRDTLFAKPVKTAPANPDLAKRVAIYAHFGNVKRPPGKAGGNIVIIRNADGWAWFIPLSGDRVSVGVVVTTEAMRAARLQPEALFWKVVADAPKLTEALAESETLSPFHVTADYNYRSRAFAAQRMLLVGDAACFLDPMFSTGVFIALLSAKFAAAEVIAAHRRGQQALGWLARRRYTRQLTTNIRTLERMVLAFYDNASFSVFMERNAPLRMDTAINALVAGHSDPPWGVRWRYWLFLLVCRVQRFRPVVPSVNFAPAKPAATHALETAGRL